MKPYHTKGILKQNKKKVEQKRNPRKQVTWMQELKHFQQNPIMKKITNSTQRKQNHKGTRLLQEVMLLVILQHKHQTETPFPL
jgi:hypothetical protein